MLLLDYLGSLHTISGLDILPDSFDRVFTGIAESANKGHVEHAEGARREFKDAVPMTFGVEFDRCKLVAIAREDDDIGNGVERGEDGRLFVFITTPRVFRCVVLPERREWNGRYDELESGGIVHLAEDVSF